MTKRIISVFLTAILLCSFLCACNSRIDGGTEKGSYTVEANNSGVVRTYSYNATTRHYTCEGVKYAYRLTLTDRLPDAEDKTTYVVLSNVKDITFEQAHEQYLSSDAEELIKSMNAVVVETRTHP